MEQSSSTEQQPKKQTRKSKDESNELEVRIKNLEAALSKIATLSGNGNHLAEFGLERWVPSKNEMRKYK